MYTKTQNGNIYLLIKPFVWRRSSGRCRHGLIKLLTFFVSADPPYILSYFNLSATVTHVPTAKIGSLSNDDDVAEDNPW